MHQSRLLILAGLLAPPLAGCDFPTDADGTLDRARAEATISAGFVLKEPGQAEPSGPDARAVAAWAEREGIRLAWHGGAETDLVEQLKRRQSAIVVGGFTTDSPWTSEVGFSLEIPPEAPGGEAVVVLVAPGENALLFSLDRAIGSLPGPSR